MTTKKRQNWEKKKKRKLAKGKKHFEMREYHRLAQQMLIEANRPR